MLPSGSLTQIVFLFRLTISTSAGVLFPLGPPQTVNVSPLGPSIGDLGLYISHSRIFDVQCTPPVSACQCPNTKRTRVHIHTCPSSISCRIRIRLVYQSRVGTFPF